jgi:hypothetical protein
MGTVMAVTGFVFLGALVLVVAYGPLAHGAGAFDRDFSWRYWLVAWVWALLCTGVVAGLIVNYAHDHPDNSPNACADKGGIWSVTGQHKELRGKVFVTVNEYACVAVQR